MKKLIFTFIFATICGISAFAANNYDFTARCSSGQTLYYKITSSTQPYSVAVTYPNNLNSNYYYNFSKPTGNLTIPSSVTNSGITYSVTEIVEHAFHGCSGLTSVIIPNSVTSIGYSAFFNCSGLTSVTIPNSITSIGGTAFYGCNRSYNQYDNAYYLGNVENQYLVLIKGISSDITSCNISNDCKVIATSAFDSYSGLTSVTIGNSVTSIGQRAFYSCSGLTSLTIPNSVTSIDYRAFWDCGGLTSVTMGSSVESIGVEAFTNCSSLMSLTIPNSVTSIGNKAFFNCSGLTSVTIGNGVTSIGNKAFFNCSGLTSVTIGNGVTSIGTDVFGGCSGLEDMTIPFVGSSATATVASASTLFGYLFGSSGSTGGQDVSQYYSSSSNTAYYIPSSLRSVTVTGGKLNYGAFYGCSMLTSVTIGSGVTSIGEKAFYNCSGLTSVTIGRAVTSIGSDAFYGCSGLTSVYNSGTIDQWCRIRFGNPQSNPIYYTHNMYRYNSLVTNLDIQSATRIEQYAFYGATCLTSVSIGNSVTSIGDYAFYDCSGLTGTLRIPNSVTSIGNQAFCNCNGLTSVSIGNGVTSIGTGVFSGCSGLEEMTIPFVGSSATATEASPSTLFGYLFGTSSYTGGQSVTQNYSTSSNTAYYIPSSLRSVTVTGGNLLYGAFSRCSGLSSVTIDNAVTSIGNHAFDYCSGLTSVTIGNSVTSIGNYAFYNCSGMTSVTIGNGVTSIGTGVFCGCGGLEEMTIPFVGSSATATEASASTLFGYLFGTSSYTGGQGVAQNYSQVGSTTYGSTYYIPSSLRSVTVTGGNLLYGAFYGCSMLTSIAIPNSVTSIGNYAFYHCSGLTGTLTIPNSVTSIGNYAFNGCSGLTWVNIPNSVTSISDYTFYGCSGLTYVNIPNSLTSIGNYAFYNCNGLTGTLTIPNSVTSIGNYAFYGCSGLTGTLTLPYSGPILGNYAFYGCNGLTSVNINNYNINYGWGMGTHTFSNCTGLTSATISSGMIGDYAFDGCSGLISVTIGNAVTRIYNYAFLNCSGLTSVTIGNAVSSISEYAFAGCIRLTSVTIPNSVTSIGQRAFSNCSGLTSVTIGTGVTSIGESAFYGCSGITDIYANRTYPPLADNCGLNTAATLWVPCGTVSAYSGSSFWGNFSDIRERLLYTLNVSSADLTMGTASVTQQPTCTDSTAIISATPNMGYAFLQWNDGNTDNPRTIMLTSNVVYIASFEALTAYTITAVSADEEMGTVTGGGDYYEDETATLTATANDGYWFVAWTDGNTDNPRTVTVTGDSTYTATFVAFHTITVTSADETLGTASGSGDYAEGSEIEISATPVEHYHFTQWNDGNTDNPRTITVTEDSTFTASFAIDRFTVTVESADTEMGTAGESGTYDYGTEIQISATPVEGYGFLAWNDDNTDNPRNVTVTEDITFTATFGAWRTISVVSADETMGTVEGTGEYVEGATVQITAIPNEHYHFEHWMIEENPTREIITDNPLTITVTGNVTYTAVFAIDQHTITVESANEAMGTVSESNTYDYGTEIQISATAAEHYHFTQWSDGNTDNPRTITVTEDATYRAEFAIDQHTITVESADEAMGTVSESNTYDYGTEIQISATATEHYHFVQWSDGNTDNPRTITVNGDATYRASFAIDQHTITVESGDIAMGTVSEGGTYDYGTEIQISATAAEHYHFVQWSDGNTDNPRTVTITSDTTFTASFAIDQHTITVESDDETMGTVSGSNTYDYGAEIQISASARDGYQFVSWNDGNTDNPRTITVVADATYIASFVSVTSIEEISAFEIAIFPNPTTDILNITSSETISEIEIVNVMGQVVRRIEINSDNAVCDVEELKAGVYVVRIHAASATLSQRKFIKE